MTPLDKAWIEFNREGSGRMTARQDVEAACLAYVSALAEDEATVERVAAAIAEVQIKSPSAKARAALRTLAKKEG